MRWHHERATRVLICSTAFHLMCVLPQTPLSILVEGMQSFGEAKRLLSTLVAGASGLMTEAPNCLISNGLDASSYKTACKPPTPSAHMALSQPQPCLEALP